jgi:N utilization substance protein A
MKLDFQVMEALELLERERGVPVDTILDALANGLVSAYKRAPGAAEEARVVIDPDAGDIVVYAQELDEDGNVVREWEDTPDDFGRIAAQTAKQVIAQRLRDAKREQVFDIYEGREGDLITGIVQQVDHRYSILDLGDAEALMPGSERIPYERLDRGNRVKALILEVRGEAKGPQIVVSRSHPDFVRRLLELEVPELLDGTIEIKAIAREPGHRTKIAVASNDPNVDPKGACVGARGSRVRQVVNELRSEKVDVVQWREDTAQFIAEALGPAKVKEVRIDEEEKEAVVIVNDHQLSLAIGREGQNARLAARLSGYRVDIRSESQERGDVEGEEPGLVSDEPSETAAAVPGGETATGTETLADELEVVDVLPGAEEETPDVAAADEAPVGEEGEGTEARNAVVADDAPADEEEQAAPVGERSTEIADGDVELETTADPGAETETESVSDEDSEQA